MRRLLLPLLLGFGAQLSDGAEPVFKGIVPSCVLVGEDIEVTLLGNALDAGASLHFTSDGITAEHVEKNRFRITARSEVPLGACDLWVATAGGLAGPRRFAVTDSPVIVEGEENDTRDTAQVISCPMVIDAQLDKAADLDWFAFAAEANSQVTIICRSRSLDGSVQPAFTLFDPADREVLHSDSRRHEPRATITTSAAGTYHLLVHERAYRKDDASFYRIELHKGPPITTRSVSEEQHLPSSLLAYASGLDGEAASQIIEESANSSDAQQTISLPAHIAGAFASRSDVDWFRFAAKKDQTLHIEAFGERLDQQMDLDVAIHDANGRQLATAKDIVAAKGIPATLPLASLDAALDWKVPVDGEYDIAIRDLYGSSIFGPDRRYELVLQEQQPNFYVVAMSGNTKPGQGSFAKRGGDAGLSLIVVRRGGFAGSVTIRAEDPPAGLSIEPCVVGEKEMTKQMQLSATQDTATGFHTLRLVAEAEIGSNKRTSHVINAAVVRSGWTRRIDEMVIYISE